MTDIVERLSDREKEFAPGSLYHDARIEIENLRYQYEILRRKEQHLRAFIRGEANNMLKAIK